MLRRWIERSSIKRVRFPRIAAASSRRCLHEQSNPRSDIVPLRKQLKDAQKQARVAESSQLRRRKPKDDRLSRWELTVGIEIHAQLNTTRKLFSRARSESHAPPNTNLASFDIALPGSQPVFQLSALVPALRAALALGCNIEHVSRFDRKHYFYHDQPSGYQITQYYQPFARNGSVNLTPEDGLPSSDGKALVIGIKQIQMEQDTAKTQESEDGTSSIDFTRSGQPLIEIISMPHIHSPQAAAAYLRKVQAILFSVDSVVTGMEYGGLRADVNVSVRPVNGPHGNYTYGGVAGLGQRTEIKNLSSFKAVEDAVIAERDRQITILESGGKVEGETRGWSATSPHETKRLRGKEGEVDYRYMPDPDVPPLYIARDLIHYLETNLPPVPEQLVTMLIHQYGLTSVDAKALILLENGQRLIYFQTVVSLMDSHSGLERLEVGKMVGNWILHELGALLSVSETTWTPDLVPADRLARVIQLQAESRITGTSAKQLLRTIFEGDATAVENIVTRDGLWFDAMSDEELRQLASQIIDENSETATAVRKGNHGKIGYLVGQLMRTGDRHRIDAKKAEGTFRAILLN